jgi:hypothetical protein
MSTNTTYKEQFSYIFITLKELIKMMFSTEYGTIVEKPVEK